MTFHTWEEHMENLWTIVEHMDWFEIVNNYDFIPENEDDFSLLKKLSKK